MVVEEKSSVVIVVSVVVTVEDTTLFLGQSQSRLTSCFSLVEKKR